VFTPPESTPGTPIVLAEIAKSNKYVVRPRQELIDGRWCHVLEYADHDCLWIDLDRGCAVLLRETRDPASNALVQKIESYEHAEVVPGLWAAKRFRNLLFDRANPQKKTVDAEAVIRLIEVNQPIAPEVFIFKPSPGSIEISSGRHFSQVVPGGADLLDEMVARLNRYKPTGNDSGGGPSDASSWAINIVSCICVVAIACIGGWRRASVE
jgi:hypothetical protein